MKTISTYNKITNSLKKPLSFLAPLILSSTLFITGCTYTQTPQNLPQQTQQEEKKHQDQQTKKPTPNLETIVKTVIVSSILNEETASQLDKVKKSLEKMQYSVTSDIALQTRNSLLQKEVIKKGSNYNPVFDTPYTNPFDQESFNQLVNLTNHYQFQHKLEKAINESAPNYSPVFDFPYINPFEEKIPSYNTIMDLKKRITKPINQEQNN